MNSSQNTATVTKNPELTRICLDNPGRFFLILFYSSTHEASLNVKKMLESLSKFQQEVFFIFIDVTVFPQGATNMQINIIPSIFFTDSTKRKFHLLENPSPSEINENIETYLPKYKQHFLVEREKHFGRIKNMLTNEISPVHVFIKGTPEAPECGFTQQMLNILKNYQLSFSYFNILLDEDLREWLRLYSNWKTYPQLYINGKIIGGLDTLKELVAGEKFEALIPEGARKHDPEQRESRLLKTAKVLLFSEGDSHEKSAVAEKLLKENGVKFSFFQVSSDETLYKYLLGKYKLEAAPFLFVEGKLLGGLEGIEELVKNKSLLKKIPPSEWRLNSEQKLDYLLNTFNIVVFLKCNLDNLQDQQSKNVIETLTNSSIPFQYYNVLADPELMSLVVNTSGISEFPQVFKGGKFCAYKDLI